FLFCGEEAREPLSFRCGSSGGALRFCHHVASPQRVVGLLVVVVIFLVVGGLARLARLLAAQSRARAWTVMTGVIALLLGISVWIGWPDGKLWFVGLCIAVDILCHGLSWSALALAERKALQEPVSPEAQEALS